MNQRYAEKRVEARDVNRGAVHLHHEFVGPGPVVPDYIPIRISVPDSVHPGDNFYVSLEFESCPQSGASSPATVSMVFLLGSESLPVEEPPNPSAVSVNVNSQGVGSVLCRFPSDSATGTVSVEVGRTVGECTGQVYASLPLEPLN
jgi:hypothetical protein